MLFNSHKSFVISDRSYMSSAKRDISKITDGIGFNEKQRGKIDIIVSELTSNLIKHNAIEGEILVKQIKENNIDGIEILSLDKGPGMRDVKRMMEDGVSTFGSKGEGLGAIKRLSDHFEIYSLPTVGTYILSRLFVKQAPITEKKPRKKTEIKAVMVPKPGEVFCGDGWVVIDKENQTLILAADGLGHGKDAHLASELAIKIFKDCMVCQPTDILKLIHNSIKQTRGIVGAIASIDLKDETIAYCGIGNIAGRLITKEGSKSLISYNGTIGHNIPTSINKHTFNWDPFTILILHSDGLKSRWDISRYPGIERLDASLMAGIIYKDNTRKTDDSLVIVAKS